MVVVIAAVVSGTSGVEGATVGVVMFWSTLSVVVAAAIVVVTVVVVGCGRAQKVPPHGYTVQLHLKFDGPFLQKEIKIFQLISLCCL